MKKGFSIRFFVIYVSLLFVAVLILALVSGPIWGLRLDYERGENLQLIQIALPTFLAYLSGAVTYATSGKPFPEPRGERGKILKVISVGGALVFALGVGMSTWVFYLSSNGSLEQGSLTFSQFSSILSLLLGVLGATTSAVAVFIFANSDSEKEA